jgi:nicotinate-nucleotide adenylyltransferase
VHFIPTNVSNSNKKIIASGVKRIEMLNIALKNEKYLVDNREILKGGVSYTIHTVESISKQFPNDHLYLIIGLDLLIDITKWERFHEIISLCNIIVSYREIDDMMNILEKPIMNEGSLKSIISTDPAIFHGSSYGKIYLEKTSSIKISSTEVRSKLKNKEAVSKFMPPKLEEWLLKNKIY